MKRILKMLMTPVLLFFISCNSGDEKTAIMPTIPAASFKILMVEHPVADFESWKAAYLAHDSIRQAYGISHLSLGVGADDPTMVLVINKIEDLAKAKEFTELPELKEAMDKAGVTGMPTFMYIDVVRNDSSQTEIKDRMMIAHRVKDFDAWLKVYDAEGMETRKGFGIIDRGIGRSSDDPNMVYILFAISDMEKVKARSSSEELKKIITDAGVEGLPQIMYFKVAD